MIKRYLSAFSGRQLGMMLLGNLLLGVGIGIFKLSGFGNDAYNGFLMALEERTGIPFALLAMLMGGVLALVEFAFGRSFLGPGTVVTLLLAGPAATAFYELWTALAPPPSGLLFRLVVLAVGVAVTGLGLAMYQTANAGVAPYDSISLILAQRFPKVPYFWCRIGTDGLCAVLCFLFGGLLGLGTLVATFGMGPIVHWFSLRLERGMDGGKRDKPQTK